MKKMMALALSILIALSAAGCSGDKGGEASSNTSSTGLIPEDGWNEIPADEDSSAASSEESASASSETSSESTSSAAGSKPMSKPSSKPTNSSQTTSSKSSTTSSKPEEKPVPGTLRAKYEPEFAEGFSIEYYYGGAKIIATHFRKTTSVESRQQRILLMPEGATLPVGAKWDKRIDGKVERVVTLASSHAGHFANLDAIDVIKGTSISESSSRIPALTDALKSGAAKTVTKKAGSETDATKYFDQELVVSLRPQVVFVGGMEEDVTAAKKLEESGLVCVYIGDFAEADYVGRAQWIELFGAFIGKEQAGQDFLKAGVKKANEVIKKTQAIEKKPEVLWFTKSGSGVNTQWFVKTDTDYTATMIRALGGKMLYPAGTTDNSIALSCENFLVYMNQADKMIFGVSMNSYPKAEDMTYFNVEGLIDFSATKAFKNDDCYGVGYDWSQDTANIGEIMQDLARALYPEAFDTTTAPNKIVKFKR